MVGIASKRTSSTGFVEPEPFGTQGRLFDFDIDGSEVGVDGARLKSRHVAFLESLLTRIGTGTNQSLEIRIGGSSDTLNRTGDFDNTGLSQRRADAVVTFLRSRLPRGVNVTFTIKAFGDQEAGKVDSTNVRDDFFRAVDVALIAPGDPEPQKPAVPPSGGKTSPRVVPRAEFSPTCVREFEMPRSQIFSVRLENVSSFGVLVKPLQIVFSIRDDQNRLEAKYTLSGANFGTVPDAALSNDPKQFRSFRTDSETRVTEFQSAVITTGVKTPTIAFTYRDKDGKTRRAQSDLDLGGIPNTPRVIVGILTMDSTCGRGVRGAEKVIGSGTLTR
jgi:hypothetical protein